MTTPKFKLTYRDYIRKFKNEQKEKNKERLDLSNNTYFIKNIFDVTTKYDLIEREYWYKQSFIKDHYYNLDVFKSGVTENKQYNCFSELVGKNGWLAAIYKESIITDDFLTGIYIAKEFIRNRDQLSNWFYYGCAKTQLAKGINAELDKTATKFIKYGADIRYQHKIKKIKKENFDYKKARQLKLSALDMDLQERNIITDLNNIFNGITKTGDISDINVIKSIVNQLNEIDDLDFYICDIYPKNFVMLYNSVIIPLMNTKSKGFSIIRMIDANEWDEKETMIVNFLLFISSFFSIVKIFKTPWGNKARYYLILSDKQKFTTSYYTNLVKYITNACGNNTPLFSKKYDFDKIIPIYKQLQIDLLDCYEYYKKDEANALFT